MNILIALLIANSSYAGTSAATSAANAEKCKKAGDASTKTCDELPTEKAEVQNAEGGEQDPTGVARYEALEADLTYVLGRLKNKQDICTAEKKNCEKECDRLASLHPDQKQAVDSAKQSNCTGPLDQLITKTQGDYMTEFKNRGDVQRSIACLKAGNPDGCPQQ